MWPQQEFLILAIIIFYQPPIKMREDIVFSRVRNFAQGFLYSSAPFTCSNLSISTWTSLHRKTLSHPSRHVQTCSLLCTDCRKRGQMTFDLSASLLPPANEVWGKVFYTCLSFCSQGQVWLPSMHHRSHDQNLGGGVCIQGCLHLGGGGFASREVCIQGELGRPPPPQLEKRAVRILLECFLVLNCKYVIST